MTSISRRGAGRLAACALAALALALVPAACGGSDDDQPGSGGNAAATPSGIGETADERRAVVVMETMARHLAGDDAGAACALMTDFAREEVATGIAKLRKRGGGGRQIATCAEGLASVLEGSVEDYEPTIRRVRVFGDRAMVAADASHVEETHRALLEREQGDWRVDTWFTNDATIRSRLQALRTREAQTSKGDG